MGCVTKPYRLAYASPGVDVYGRAKTNNYYQWICSNKNTFDYKKVVPQQLNNKFKHYLLDNILINCKGTAFLNVYKKDDFISFNEPSIEKDGTLKSGVSKVSDLYAYRLFPIEAKANYIAQPIIESESYAEFVLYNPNIYARFSSFYLSWSNGNKNKINNCKVIISSGGEIITRNVVSGLNNISVIDLETVLSSIDWIVVRVWNVNDPSVSTNFPKIGIMDMDGSKIWSIVNGFTGYGNIKLNQGEFINKSGYPAIHSMQHAVNINLDNLDNLRNLKNNATKGRDMLVSRAQPCKYWVLYGGVSGIDLAEYQPRIYNLDGTLATLYDLGPSSLRPKPTATNAISVGTKFYDTSLMTLLYCKKSVGASGYADWITTYGAQVNHGVEANVTSIKGTSATREAMTMYAENEGLQYYDTTLHKYVIWNGTSWTNLDGTPIE